MGTAKMANGVDIGMPEKVYDPVNDLHSPGASGCGSCIIHVFLLLLMLSVPPTVFTFPMALFAFFGLAIFSLRVSVAFAFSFTATCITTICLPSPTATANVKLETAPSTCNATQQQCQGHLRLGNQPEGAKEKENDGERELPDDCGSSCRKPETDASGLQS